MNLGKIVRQLGLEVQVDGGRLNAEVHGGYASDLISDVIANAREGDLWVTLQTHQNTIAVASMKDLAGVVLVNGRQPEEDTLRKAKEENVPLLVCSLPAFELIGRLHQLGLSGIRT